MSGKKTGSRSGDHPTGVLDEGSSVDTTGVGIIDSKTSKVKIVLPATVDESDDDVVDDPAASRTPTKATRAKKPAAKKATPAKATPTKPVLITHAAAKPAVRATKASPRTTPAPVDEPVRAAKRLEELSPSAAESADALTAERLIDSTNRRAAPPEDGWRRWVYVASAKFINLGDSKLVRERKQLTARIAAPLPGGVRFVAVLSRKGGVGKTTVTTLLGMAMAEARDDRVVAVDANPDRGTLADRITQSTNKSVRDLAKLQGNVNGYQDISSIVARDITRLDVIASNSDPAFAEAFSGEDYLTVADVAGHFYSMVLTDTGTGIVHSAMTQTLAKAHQVVIVAGLSVDEARLASETLTWLAANGHEELAQDAIVVLNQAIPGRTAVRQSELERHFASRVRHVIKMPYDLHIAAGGPITFSSLDPETRLSARNLAALVVESMRQRSA